MPRVRVRREIPDLHLVLMVLPTLIIVVCLLLLPFYPIGDRGFLQTTITACLTFMFGKFTNGFGKPLTKENPEETEETK